jgi:hypothetical protein
MALFAVNSMLKNASQTYLPPNSQSMQKPIEGGLPELYAVSLYKGAIVLSEHNRTEIKKRNELKVGRLG